MKKIFLALLATFFTTTFISCKKFLETKPKDFLTPAQYYENEEQLQNALNGVYDVLGAYNVYYNLLTSNFGAEADEGFYRSTSISGPQVYEFNSSHSYITVFWQTLYGGISRANFLLANIDKPTNISDQRRGEIKGEALFLRAYYYFLLAVHFGGVPMLLEPVSSASNNDRARASLDEIYIQIEKDMLEAEGLVKSAKAIGFGGRVSKSTVRGILARFYLYWAGYPLRNTDKFQESLKWSKSVIESGEHVLDTSYQQVFINYMQDKYEVEETIWEVEFYGNGQDAYKEYGWHAVRMGIRGASEQLGYSYGFFGVTKRLYDLYEEGDVRRDWAIAPYYYTKGDVKVFLTPTQIYDRNIGKYRREYETLEPKAKSANGVNYPLLRYSDVLLMYAEAENMVNGPTAEAFAALNTVRERAKASLLTPSDLPDKESFLKEIQRERSRELCFEALRKYDLIRWGIFLEEMKKVAAEFASAGTYSYGAAAGTNVQERNLLFPIPARELSLNRALVQNPGW